MGRQAYLTKIAFGRSAFQPPQSATELLDAPPDASQPGLPQPHQVPASNHVVQLSDGRGNANPCSQEYGKKLRDAQNDVLASIGIVERRRTPSDGLVGSYDERLERLEAEDAVGSAIALTATMTDNLFTWWTGTIRERILTFPYPDAATLAQIVSLERASSGGALFYAGLAPWFFSMLSIQAITHNMLACQPIDRLLHAIGANLRTLRFLRRSKTVLGPVFRLALDALFYPFLCYADLQRLGYMPARPLLPSLDLPYWFLSTSLASPTLVPHSNPTSMISLMKVVVLSPVVLMCAEQGLKRWIVSSIDEAVESSVIRPDHTDMQGRDALVQHRKLAFLGLRRPSHPYIRNTINKLLTMLGWGAPFANGKSESNGCIDGSQSAVSTSRRSLDIGGTRVVNLSPLEIAGDHGQEQTASVEMANAPFHPMTPPTPLTPTASMHDQGDDDPRIRITSREGIVEMEVHLPSRMLSAGIEDGETAAATRYNTTGSALSRPHHRVTQLSCEPAQMISEIVKRQLARLATLPMRLIVLRVVAASHVACQGMNEMEGRKALPLPSLSSLRWRLCGVAISRVALCSAVDLAIELGVWGLQYAAIAIMGQTVFGWGSV